MNIALIGSTGWMGSWVLPELLERGHAVTAIVRRADALNGSSARTVLADVYDESALVPALGGVDAVVSAFNPGWNEPDLYDKYMTGARTIQRATRAAGVPRLLVIGGAASLYGPDGRQLIENMTVPPPYDAGVKAARDYHAEIRAEADLDWVFLSPPLGCGPAGPTARRGTYRLGTDSPVFDEQGVSTISGPDLAIAVADELELQRHHQQRFTVAY